MILRRLLLPVLLLALAAAAAGCGNKEAEAIVADTEGIWIDVGPLDYHIQGSRTLNPSQVPDDRYLSGLPEDESGPAADETWFAVFLRIENKTDGPAPTAEDFEIEDTAGDVYKPIDIDTEVNPFAYQPLELGEDEVVPHPDSTQELDSTAGAMLLFKLPLDGYANRPLEFIIHAPPGSEGPEQAKIALDV
jgi:hypothetical protein